MIIAEELDLPVDEGPGHPRADARPELLFNQLTGGSNTTMSTYTPIRVAAALAKGALLEAAAVELGADGDAADVQGRRHPAPDGGLGRRTASWRRGGRADDHAGRRHAQGPRRASRVIGAAEPGRRARRRDRPEEVHHRPPGPGRAADHGLPGARRSTAPRSGCSTRPTSRRCPGVRDVAIVDTGVAVRAETFGQCIDAVRAMRVDWATGTVDGLVRRRHPRRARRRPSCRWPCPTCRRWPRPSRATSTSTSAATPRSRPTARSPTCAPTGPRSGPGSRSPIVAQAEHRRGARAAAGQGQGPRHHGRRLVRPPALLRRRARGRQDLARRWASRSS